MSQRPATAKSTVKDFPSPLTVSTGTGASKSTAKRRKTPGSEKDPTLTMKENSSENTSKNGQDAATSNASKMSNSKKPKPLAPKTQNAKDFHTHQEKQLEEDAISINVMNLANLDSESEKLANGIIMLKMTEVTMSVCSKKLLPTLLNTTKLMRKWLEKKKIMFTIKKGW